MLSWLQGKERGTFFSYEEGREFFEEARKGIYIWFNVKNPVDSFVGRTEQSDNLHQMLHSDKVSQMVCISGLGWGR